MQSARSNRPPLPDPPPLAIGRAAAAAPEGRAAASRQRAPPLGIVGSLALHLLPLLLLLQWTQTRTVPPEVIPLRLVIEQPPPPPPPAPKAEEQQKPPPSRLASEEFGDVTAPEKPETAELTPPPKPAPAEPEAAPPPAVDPTPRVERPPKPAAAARPAPNPHAAAHRRARFPGPAATRDEYLAYCTALIRRYYDMLPDSFLAGRRGRTVLALLVLDDGTIARIAVKESSGFHDIDARVERMVAAVRRFPPLPQWIQTSSVTLNYVQGFSDGMAPH